MPYFMMETNKKLDEATKQDLLKKMSTFVANLLGKPEKYIMISINTGSAMIFDGNTYTTAYVTLKSIGLAKEKCSEYSSRICDFIQKELGIPCDRVYIDFGNIDSKMFGWNKDTF